MIKIDKALLVELGVTDLSAADEKLLLGQMYETLERRVGEALAGLMSDVQLNEFEQYFEAHDDKGAFRWLEANFPDYKEIVAAAFADLKEEVRAAAPSINGCATEADEPA